MSNAITPAVRRFAGAAVLTLAVAACSSAGASPSPAPATAAPTVGASTAPTSAGGSAAASFDAKAEVDAVTAGLDKALELYKAGNQQGALDEIAETYEEHFEKIEDPLGDVDHDFMEDLESLIATKIRAAITGNQPAAAVEALVTEAKAKLATAKGMLQ
jgi:hypothetical protein